MFVHNLETTCSVVSETLTTLLDTMMKMHVLLGVVVLQLASVQSFTPTTRLNKYSHGSIKSPASSRSTTSQSVVMSLLSDPDMVHSLFSDHALTVAEGIRDVAIFKGKTLSLLHPVMMFGLLGLSLSTGLLGLQWRRQRTLGDEISSLKKTMPPVDAESDAPPSPAALEIQAKVDALTAERKQLAAEGPRDKHFSQGALLAFLGTFFAIEVSLISILV